MTLATFSGTKVTGWRGGDPSDLEFCRPLSLQEFQAPQDDDRMVVMYTTSQTDEFPRLLGNAPSLLDARGEGEVVMLEWLIVEVDNLNHRRWDSLDEAQAAMDDLDWDDPVLASAGFYSTPAGYRLMWRLETPIPAIIATSTIRKLQGYLLGIGIGVDTQCVDWTRLMRLPRANRPGYGVLDSIIDLSPLEDGETLDLIGLDLMGTEVEGDAFVDDAGECPIDEPEPLTIKDWVMVPERYTSDLRAGRPVLPMEGSHYNAYRGILYGLAQRFAKNGETPDPEKLVSYVWASAEATDKESCSLSNMWKLAVTACRKATVIDQGSEGEEDTDLPPHPVPPVLPKDLAICLKLLKKSKARVKELTKKVLRGSPKISMDHIWQVADSLAAVDSNLTANELYRLLYPSVERSRLETTQVWKAVRDSLEHAELNRDSERSQLEASFLKIAPLLLAHTTARGTQWLAPDLRQDLTYVPVTESSFPVHYTSVMEEHLPEGVDFEAASQLKFRDLAHYSQRVDDLRIVAPGSGYTYDPWRNPDTGMVEHHLVQGVWGTKATTPQYHEDIDAWLRLLVVDQETKDMLDDWLAAVPQVTEPVCALYFHGPAGCGKTLFANLCSQVFGAAAVPYGTMYKKFKDELMTSPVLLADEELAKPPKFEGGQSAGAILRSTITQRAHTFEMKNRPACTINGCVRVIFTSNDGKLPLGQDLDKTSMAAIAQRIAYIRVPDYEEDGATTSEASKYLEGLGEVTTATWFNQGRRAGRFAEHVAWLRITRKLKRKNQRLLVQGPKTEWHDELLINTGLLGALWESLSLLIKKKQTYNFLFVDPVVTLNQGDDVVLPDRCLYVRRDNLHKEWQECRGVKRSDFPNMEKAVRAAGGRPVQDPNGNSYWKIPALSTLTATRNSKGEPCIPRVTPQDLTALKEWGKDRP